MPTPIDDDARKLAVSEQNRNLVITAGAGTGKTTLLVNRILHLLLGHRKFQKEESPILKIVAMTFTEKAASDMKIRLMGELEKIVSVINGNAPSETEKKVEKFLTHIRDTYQTTYHEIERRARKSLEDMDKALIGTIHAFCAYVLRLYPIESGVTPGFIVDEGDAFDELFTKEWVEWLDRELVLDSPNATLWKKILKRVDIHSLMELTKRLSGFTVPPDSLTQKSEDAGSVLSLINPLSEKIRKIIPCCEKASNNLLTQLHEISNILDGVKKEGVGYLKNLLYDLEKNPSTAKSGWIPEHYETAQELIKECHALLKKLKAVDSEFVADTISLVLPFAKSFRQTYLSRGYVSFDSLLTLTRDLLQNSTYRYMRDTFKSEFRTVLVDEFQDTDPVQYEIVLFLSESLEHYSQDARKVILEPGKLFIVGDPKQSIYAFRRADIEAYEHVVKQVCGEDDTLKLQENFRSHSGIIGVVNQLFDGKIMVEHTGLQPGYIPIHANRPQTLPSQKVDMVLVSGAKGEEIKADEARKAEAEWIARWITEHVQTEVIEDPFSENRARTLAYKDIALVLRAFTQVKPYIEAFKHYSIPYIVEGEKYFYTTQEILDFINLLRIIENPHDTIALIGVLRSPTVGLTDREIYELKENHLLDYLRHDSWETLVSHKPTQKNTRPHSQGEIAPELETPTPPDPPAYKRRVEDILPDTQKIVEPFYDFLRRIHARAGTIPVSRLIAEIVNNKETHVAEITAAAWHGEQRLANLWKLHQMACDMEQSECISLKTFIDRIKTRIQEAREEGESPLSDETLDVVKVLSIHKSKGLEFPVVILGNLHGEVRKDNETLDTAVFDWTTTTTGIVIGKGTQQVRNLQSIVIEKKLNERSWEEEKRVLYVAMTRAKERLILTGAWKDDDKSYMGLITKAMRDTAGIELGDETVTDGSLQKNANDVSSLKNRAKIPPLANEEEGGEQYISAKNGTRFSLGDSEVFVERFRFDGTHRFPKPSKEEKLDVDLTSFAETWKKRQEAMKAAAQASLFTSPTTLSENRELSEGAPSAAKEADKISEAYPNYMPIIGSVCHNVLEGWDFHGTKESLEKSVESAIQWIITAENGKSKVIMQRQIDDSMDQRGNRLHNFPDTILSPDTELIKAEVIKILSDFIGSEAYKELQNAHILGREIPILLKWDGQIMRGTIDILYKTDNRFIIADYKTDYVKPSDLPARAKKYQQQKEIYTEAAKRCLTIENPEFKLIFLRLGKAVFI